MTEISDSTFPRTLIADDQPDVLAALRLLLKGEGFQTEAVTSPAAVLEALKAHDFDLLLMDLNYARDTTSGREGLDLLTRVRDLDSTLPIVVMTAWGTIDLAVEAMRRGVRDFVQKPWENAQLLATLRTQIARGRDLRKKRRLAAEMKALGQDIACAPDLQSLAGMVAERVNRALQGRPVAILMRNSGEEAMETMARVGFIDETRIASMLGRDKRFLNITDDESSNISQAEGHRYKEIFLLIAPIILKGELIGSVISVGKLTGAEPDTEEKEFLIAAAEMVGRGISGLRLRGHDREVEEAREIQKGLLPNAIPQVRGCEISGSWRPARVVSGDYFDVLKFSHDKAALAVADVSGKGMPAALLMSNVQAAVRACASEDVQPEELCSRVNRIISSNTASDKFITFFYCLLDAENRRLVYSNAGHNAPVLARRDGSIVRLEEGGAVLGPFPEWAYEQREIALRSGDRVILFTDGLTEARNHEGEEFGEERLIDLILENSRLGASRLQEKILQVVTFFSDGHFQDDVTLIVMSME